MAIKEYTAEQRAEYEAKNQAEMDALIEKINNGVEMVFQSGKFKEYLKFASKFTDYSASNTMLISLQKPESTLVAAYGKWKKLGRQVNKGEHGIEILAPVTYKTNQILESERPAKDEFGNPIYNPDGTERMEAVEKPVTGLAFKKTYVFDVSQTSGKELPEPVSELQGDIETDKMEAVFKALHKLTGIEFEFKDIKGSAKGYYSPVDNKIVIRQGMSDAQTLKTAFHETAHNLLHDPKKGVVTAKSPRNEKEVQAESVAFMVAEKMGMDTSEYSFPYIASWSDGQQLEQLKRSLQEIHAAAKKISNEIDSELLKMQKRNLSLDEKLTDADLDNTQKAEFIIEDCTDRGVTFDEADQKKIIDFAVSKPDIQETVRLVSDMEQIQKQRDSYGYDFTKINPLESKQTALEAFSKGEPVYLLYPDNTEGLALECSDIESFDGFFGTEKGGEKELLKIDEEYTSELIPVSKETALEMWENDLDVYIDGVRAERREDIENAPELSRFFLGEYQYSAQLDFDKTSQRGNIQNMPTNREIEAVKKNPNVIGNTPYKDLGEKDSLQYYTNLKNRHADNIAKQLEENGICFSGLRKGYVTTITINKADISAYEEAVKFVKESYSRHTGTQVTAAKPQQAEKKAVDKPVSYIDIPIYTEKYSEAKTQNNLEGWKANRTASEACVKLIDSNLSEEYENRNLEGFVKQLEDTFGIERVMYTVAATIQVKEQDGRFTKEVKNRAALFPYADRDQRLQYLTERHPVMLNHLYEVIIDREKELMQNKSQIEKKELSSYFDDKFLLATERADVFDDHRGIPVTEFYQTAVNERFVDGVGWLDDMAFERERRMSDDPKVFDESVTKINISYINELGETGQADISCSEYALFLSKTYLEENRTAFETALSKYDEHKRAAGIEEKPTEYYAVRKINDHKFVVVTLDDYGFTVPVKNNLNTVEEAKIAVMEIYNDKKDKVRCELIHPQTLDEKAIEIFRLHETVDLNPDILYQIELNKDKSAPAEQTHCLQEYIKNADNAYDFGRVILKGSYDECRRKQDEMLKPEMFEVYQVKNDEKYRDIIYENYENLQKAGKVVNIDNYDKVYEAPVTTLPTNSKAAANRLEAIFMKFNIDHPSEYTGRSLSVSDVVILNQKAYYVDSVGFKQIDNFEPLKSICDKQEETKSNEPEIKKKVKL